MSNPNATGNIAGQSLPDPGKGNGAALLEEPYRSLIIATVNAYLGLKVKVPIVDSNGNVSGYQDAEIHHSSGGSQIVMPQDNPNAAGGTLEITDGTHTVTGVTELTVSGATVGGTTPDATLTISSGGGFMGEYNVSQAYTAGQTFTISTATTIDSISVPAGYYGVPPAGTDILGTTWAGSLPANPTGDQVPVQAPAPTSGTYCAICIIAYC